MITGLNIAGFGAGALITAPVAEHLISAVGVSHTFMTLGVIYSPLVSAAAVFMNNPPEGYRPAGWNPPLKQQQQQAGNDYTFSRALKTWQWYGLWAILFFNTLAGISIISQAAPLAQETTHVSAVVAAGLVGIISIANGAGRFLWAWCSDFLGRARVFQVMLLTQAVVFFALSRIHNFGGLAVLAFIVLLCYGGGFGTMPAFASDFFGSRNIGSIYGLMLTAWGFAGVSGPTLIAYVRQSTGYYTVALELIAGIMLLSSVLPFVIRPPKAQTTDFTDTGVNQPKRAQNPKQSTSSFEANHR
jgi:OFA family oxalate/formate antiporter-like MFS transporter